MINVEKHVLPIGCLIGERNKTNFRINLDLVALRCWFVSHVSNIADLGEDSTPFVTLLQLVYIH